MVNGYLTIDAEINVTVVPFYGEYYYAALLGDPNSCHDTYLFADWRGVRADSGDPSTCF